MPARLGAPLRRPPLLAVAVTAAMLMALSACGDKEAPNTVAPDGFVVVKDASAGFALAVPADWQQVPLPGSLDEFDKEASELTGRNPRLAPAILQARQLLQFGGRVMAVSPDGTSIVNLTVDKADEKNLDEVARATTAKLQEAGATDLSQQRATTGAGPALKLTFKLVIEGLGGNNVTANETQYYVLHKGKSFVITVQNGTPQIADAVAASLRLR